MGFDYSVSMAGLRTAENQLNDAARKVAGSENGASGGEAADRVTLSGGTDIAGAMVETREAGIVYKANLEMIAEQMDLEEEILDLFG
jgi:hypothetical protein